MNRPNVRIEKETFIKKRSYNYIMNQGGRNQRRLTGTSSFYDGIRASYGIDAADTMKMFATTGLKMTKLTTRKDFLISCRKKRIYPNHIIRNIRSIFQSIERGSPHNNEIDNITSMCRRRILNLEIKVTIYKLTKLQNSLERLKNIISISTVEESQKKKFFDTQKGRWDRFLTAEEERLKDKMIVLEKEQFDKLSPMGSSQWIYNDTNTVIPVDVATLVGLGPRHGLPVTVDKKITFKLLADVEYALEAIEEENDKDIIRSEVVRTIEKHKFIRHNAIEEFYIKASDNTRNFLKTNEDIIFVKSDKGNMTVAMNKSKYFEEGKKLLADTNTYKTTTDPTNRYTIENNNFYKKLCDKKMIDNTTRKRLTTYKATVPRIYFLPKYHKQGMPLRPIVSSINSITYQPAKFIADILAKIPKSPYYIRNSYDFKNYIDKQVIHKDWIMISLDVISLFTKLPFEIIYSAIVNRWTEISKHTKIHKEEFLTMIKRIIGQTYFVFDGVIYEQLEGTPMGSSLSPILAELAMDDILTTVISWIERELKIKLTIVKKYVDDLFLVVPQHSVLEIVAIFNSANIDVQFTYELEKENRINYLDISIIKDDVFGTITTRWYKKEIASGRFLNFQSIHPINQKMSVLQGYVDRVLRLSSVCYLAEEKKVIYDGLKLNGYPKYLINLFMDKYLARAANLDDTIVDAHNGTTTEIQRASLQYIKGISENVAKSFRRRTNDISFAFRNVANVNDLLNKMKDPLEMAQKSNIVYEIRCNDCIDKVYIGVTGQMLKQRLTQHRSDVRIKKRSCALAEHALNSNHIFDFDNARILTQHHSYEKLLILEKLHIMSAINCINKKSIEASGISPIYAQLFEFLNNH